jgi:hypothetical protein
MSDICTTSPVVTTAFEPETQTVPAVVPVLITEQEVVFSTAAATARTTTTRWWHKAIRRLFLASTADGRPARRHYPKHCAFLDQSCLAREMDRL